MKTRLVRVGEEQAVVVDPNVLEELGITSDSELEIVVEDGCLVISKPGTRGRRTEPGVEKSPRSRRPTLPIPPAPRPPRDPAPPEPEYGFPKKQPW